MNQASTFQINFVIALVVVAFLCMAPLTFAQSTNYYNSINPDPGGNPSVTNTIVPGASNVPTGVVTPLPATPDENDRLRFTSNPSFNTAPSVPNTGSGATSVPGVPNTGAGGNASTIFLTLILATLVGLAGISTMFRQKKV